jgi:hypothetical protein
MNKKDKQIIEKLLKIAEKQQKIIEKLAQQDSITSGTPLTNYKYDKSNPHYYDPLNIGLDEIKYPSNKEAPAPKPSGWLDKYMEQPAAPLPNALPTELVATLDKSPARQMKDRLTLSVNGKTVGVRYNADQLKMSPTQVQQLLQQSLPGYTIADPIGEHNSGMKDWQPNY